MSIRRSLNIQFVQALIIINFLLCVACNPRELPIIKEKLKEMDDVRTEETLKVIRKNPKLSELDKWCRETPLPGDFSLVAVQLSQTSFISYYYFSEADFDNSEKSFKTYFANNEWEVVDKSYNNRVIAFKKSNQFISIQFGGMGSRANYSITCKDLTLSKDN